MLIDRCFTSILLYWTVVLSALDESKQKHPSVEVENINERVYAPDNAPISPTLLALPTMTLTILDEYIQPVYLQGVSVLRASD